MLLLGLFASPAIENPLEGENGFCVLLGLTLIGILAGWALLFVVPPRTHIPAGASLALVVVPAFYIFVAAWFPPPERLAVVAPVLPLILAGAFRAYFRRRTAQSSSAPAAHEVRDDGPR